MYEMEKRTTKEHEINMNLSRLSSLALLPKKGYKSIFIAAVMQYIFDVRIILRYPM